MTWVASERYGLTPPPNGLALVQDLLNTVSAGRPRKPDLLGDLELAREWAAGAALAWGAREPVELSEADIDQLRDLRADLRVAVDGPVGSAEAGPEVLRNLTAGLILHRDGRVVLAPRGEGWRQIATAALIEIAAAQQVDLWRRLKVCRNDRCSVAFFDRSKNNSGVWHDVRVCGNAVNLRASRARRKALTGAQSSIDR
ncbi:CGNR zinc finger domain-containing protein [Pseudonocardia yuanmonensis]|uniref:CGNR zinc finger domain-containing protein n=1 Tax=Pseudonocardia yuanmonensis TaxID=1095914 RepID=UPI0031F0B716